MQTQIQKFADLGKAFRQLRVQVLPEFADSNRQPVNDPEVIEEVRSLLEEEIGDLDQITELTIDDADTFKGQAIQRLTLGKSQVYQFVISPNGMTYKMVNAADMAEFADGEEGWAEIIEFAATKGKSGKKLNCKPGNMQCGGKCQSGSKNCYANMTPEQKEKTQTAAKKAKSKPPKKLSDVELAQGDYDNAKQNYEEWKAINPNSQTTKRAKTRLNEAEKRLEQVKLDALPKNVRAKAVQVSESGKKFSEMTKSERDAVEQYANALPERKRKQYLKDFEN